jgi:hypothetical protein
MNTTEILDAIKEQVVIMEAEHAKTSKIARGRARSAANNIKKLAAEFKKTSTAEDKA